MISVCMSTYNGEAFIYKQINSILPQLSVHDELVISDDSSSDKTVEIIKSFGDKRIRLLENNSFRSTIFNLENALKQAKGDILFLSDQDDVWKENKVSVLMKHLENYDLVLSNCHLIDEQDQIIQENYYSYYFQRSTPTHSFLKNLIKNPYLGCAMAFRRSLLEKALPFPRNIAMHDIWIGTVAAAKFKVHFTNEILFSWRRHKKNVTFSIDRPDNKLSDNSLMFKLKYRLVILFALFKRIVFNT